VDDRVRYDAHAHGMTFAGERDRGLHAKLAERAHGEAHTAEVRTRTFRGGNDAFRLAGRGKRFVYTHHGPATTFSVALGRAGKNGMPVRFESRRLRIRRGERATFNPRSWRRLGRVRVTFTGGPGGRRTVVLRDRSRFAGRAAITRLAVRRAHGKRSLTLRARFRRVAPQTSAIVAFRVLKGRRTVARRSVVARRARRGRRTFRARVKLPDGRFRLVGYLTLARAGTAPDSRTVSKRIRFRVR